MHQKMAHKPKIGVQNCTFP